MLPHLSPEPPATRLMREKGIHVMIPEDRVYPQSLIRQPPKSLHACALPVPCDGERWRRRTRSALRKSSAYSPQNTRVLPAEYSNTLRKVQFGTPQGIRPPCSKKLQTLPKNIRPKAAVCPQCRIFAACFKTSSNFSSHAGNCGLTSDIIGHSRVAND